MAMKIKLGQIAECIYNKVKEENIDNLCGLYNEKFGALLFYYSKYFNVNKFVLLTDVYIENILREFGANIESHSFS